MLTCAYILNVFSEYSFSAEINWELKSSRKKGKQINRMFKINYD